MFSPCQIIDAREKWKSYFINRLKGHMCLRITGYSESPRHFAQLQVPRNVDLCINVEKAINDTGGSA